MSFIILLIIIFSYLIGHSLFTSGKIKYLYFANILTILGVIIFYLLGQNCVNGGRGELGCLVYLLPIIALPLVTLPGSILGILMSLLKNKKVLAIILSLIPGLFVFLYFLLNEIG